jgi:hypothetical protein
MNKLGFSQRAARVALSLAFLGAAPAALAAAYQMQVMVANGARTSSPGPSNPPSQGGSQDGGSPSTSGRVVASPTSLNFGSLETGQSRTLNASVTNTGTSTATVSVGSPGVGYTVASDCPGSMPAGASCALAVTFAPSTAGVYSSTLRISNGSQQAQISLSGQASTPGGVARLQFAPTDVQFGNVQVGQTLQLGVSLMNSGSAPAQLQGMGFGSGAAQFSQSNNCGGTLAIGASCSVIVAFTPTTAAAHNGTLLATLASGEGAILTMAGSGTQADLVVPANHDFGTVQAGSSTYLAQVAISNAGTTAAQGLSVNASGSGFTADLGSCPTTLAPSAACSLNVGFQRSQGGSYSGTLVVSATGVPSKSVALHAVSEGTLALTPAQLTFAATPVGTTSATQTLTLSSTRSSATLLSGIGIAAGSSDFAQSNDCGASLAAGASCSITVTMTPSQVGARQGTVAVSHEAGTALVAGLSGSGVAQADLSVQPSYDFGTQPAGFATKSADLYVTNVGTDIARNITYSTTGAGFSVVPHSCAPNMDPQNGYCYITVQFQSTQTGVHTGTLHLSADGLPTKTVSLQAFAEGTVVISPTTLTFPGRALGVTSDTQSVTLTNTRSTPVTFTGISVATGASNFAQSNNCGATLTTNQSCTITVSMTPSQAGNLSGTLRAAYEGTWVQVALNGTGLAAVGGLTPVTSASFGSVGLSSTTIRQFQFTNAGNITATGVYAALTTAGNGMVIDSTNCGTQASPVSIGAGQNCLITLRWAPTAAGSLGSDSIAVVGSFQGSPASVALSGTAGGYNTSAAWSSSSSALVTPSAAARDFGTVTRDKLNLLTLYLRNTGNNGYLQVGARLSGADAVHFRVKEVKRAMGASPANCVNVTQGGGVQSADGQVVTPCRADAINGGAYPHLLVTIEYQPTALGTHSVTLTPTTDNGTPLPAGLVLTGVSQFNPSAVWSTTHTSTVALTSSNLTFSAAAGGGQQTKNFILRNVGTHGNLAVGYVLTGDTAQFRINQVGVWTGSFGGCRSGSGGVSTDGTATLATCKADDASGGSAPHLGVAIRFTPTAAGNYSVTLTPVTDNGTALPGAITLTGSTP